jgi:amidase
MSSLIPDEERDVPFLSKQHSHYYFDAKIAAAATVDCTSAEEPVVVFETSDESYEKTSRGEYVPLETFNAVTGPVFVRGADVGDALVVTVLDIRIVRTWVVALPGYGGLGNFVEQDIKEQVVKELVLEEYLSESDDTKARPRTRVWLSDRLGVDVRPMIGCIGVAPAKGTCSTLAPIFPTGGNMDVHEFAIGSSVLLPVKVAGGLLSVGDVHCCMGQGEPCTVALEASAVVTLKISVRKSVPRHLPYPLFRTGCELACLGVSKTFARARGLALCEASLILQDPPYLLSLEDAEAYVTAHARCRFAGPASIAILAAFPEPGPPTLAQPSASASGAPAASVSCRCASASLERGYELALGQAYIRLRAEFGLTALEAYGFACAAVGLHIEEPSQTSTTVVAVFPVPVLTLSSAKSADISANSVHSGS